MNLPLTQDQIGIIDIKLGWIQLAIESRVRIHNISITEWNLKTERVTKFLGDLLWHRDYLLRHLDQDYLFRCSADPI